MRETAHARRARLAADRLAAARAPSFKAAADMLAALGRELPEEEISTDDLRHHPDLVKLLLVVDDIWARVDRRAWDYAKGAML